MEPVKSPKNPQTPRFPCSMAPIRAAEINRTNPSGVEMADVVFVALTIALFVILGLVVRAVERL